MINIAAIKLKFVRIFKMEFIRNIISLSGGVLIGQAIAMSTSPLITRLFTPENFGILAVFIMMTEIMAPTSSLSYTQAIVLPREDSEAVNLVGVSFLLVCISSLLCQVVAILWHNEIAALFGFKELAFWIMFLPTMVLISGFLRIIRLWSIRVKLFKDIAVANIIGPSIRATVKIFIGFLIGAYTGGLIAGNLAGAFCVLIFLSFRVVNKDTLAMMGKTSIKSMKQAAYKYNKFPYYSTPTALIDRLSNNAVVLLFGFFFTQKVVGLYFLGKKTLQIPNNFLSQSVQRVYYQKASDQYANGQKILNGFVKTTLGLIVFGCLPFGALALFGPTLFSFVFGQEWADAGLYIQVLSPMFFLVFINAPSNAIYNILQKQKIKFIWQTVFSFARFAAIIGGYLVLKKAIGILALYSFVSVMFLFIHMSLAYLFIKREQTKSVMR
jgi:O-antigen/teichoic acid export membrane protein